MQHIETQRISANQRTVHWKSTGVWLLSPLVVSLSNLVLVFIAVMLPPDWLSRTIEARDICFLNLRFLLITLISESCFLIGIGVAALLFSRGRFVVKKSPFFEPTRSLLKISIRLAWLVIVGELIAATILIVKIGLGSYLLALKNPEFGTLLREHIVTAARIGGINVLATQNLFLPALLIVVFVTLSYHGRKKSTVLTLAIMSMTAFCLTNALTFTRWPILEAALSALIVYILIKNSSHGISLNKVVRLLLYFLSFSLIIFLGINLLKTNINGFNVLVGYIFGSYNNAAAVISGYVRQPFSGSTYVTLGAIWNAPFLGGSIREIGRSVGLDLPSASAGATVVWSSWSAALSGTGLNPTYQWDTVFGAVYGDVGPLFPLVFFLYGLFSQYFFIKSMDFHLLHSLIYVFILVSLITWFTSVFISNTSLDDYVVFSLFLYSLVRRQWNSSIRVGEATP
ncbi:hypothetical protein [Acidithiobacillus caldus]|jgi:hypothetical protein|uniref:hypothetical protein n=1 Tax=Acidithiobacillus caldus TaxID=33059 RepID=UPI00114C9D81|nr:hypothetical protein [Acidithiobacillus caldus]